MYLFLFNRQTTVVHRQAVTLSSILDEIFCKKFVPSAECSMTFLNTDVINYYFRNVIVSEESQI